MHFADFIFSNSSRKSIHLHRIFSNNSRVPFEKKCNAGKPERKPEISKKHFFSGQALISLGLNPPNECAYLQRRLFRNNDLFRKPR